MRALKGFLVSAATLAVSLLAAPIAEAREVERPVSLAQIRDHLIRYEGYRLAPYRDGASWSVGVGHNLTAHGQRAKPRYTRNEVEAFLMKDISWSLDVARKGIDQFDALPQQVQLIAISVAFTVGRTGFERFTSFRRALSYRAYSAATVELADSRWANQVSPSRYNAYIRILRAL